MNNNDPQLLAPTKAVILAAGRGKRLKPYTDHTPKPLLAINNQSMLESIFISLKECGVFEVCIVVNHLAVQIKDFARDGRQWGLNISFAHQEKLMGTADALRTAADFITSTSFILASDYALPRTFLTDLKIAYSAQSCPLFASLKKLSPDEISQKSSVRFNKDGYIAEIIEKPPPGQAPTNIAASPFLIVPVEINRYLKNLTLSSRGEYEIMDVINRMIRDGYSMSGLLQPQPAEWTI